MGWWATVNSKIPVKYSEGEAAGQLNPADIRGSYTFGEISTLFEVPLADLGAAFQIPSDSDAASFQLKSLEEIYGGLPEEIGTSSVRLFVALYKGLPVDLSDGSFLLPRGVEILKQQGKLTPEQETYLETHTVGDAEPAVNSVTPTVPALVETPVAEPGAVTPTEHVQPDRTLTGKTTFQEVLDWGVPQAALEKIIGEALPSPQTVVKDFCTLKGLVFSTIKPAVQAEIDQVNP
jgi:hypothetical protein